jgi:hypothetical protein
VSETALVESQRDEKGKFRPGNTAALKHGLKTAAFWSQVEQSMHEAIALRLVDLGFTPETAPAALLAAVRGEQQAIIIRDSAFARLVETSGPLTSKDRRRSAFAIWAAASDRAERHQRLLGLQRQPRAVDPIEALRKALAPENGDAK